MDMAYGKLTARKVLTIVVLTILLGTLGLIVYAGIMLISFMLTMNIAISLILGTAFIGAVLRLCTISILKKARRQKAEG